MDAADAQRDSGLYDGGINHIWNRVHRQLHVRTAAEGTEYGDDEVDPLLWRETRYLLEGPSHAKTLAVLDEFLNTHGERLIRDPLKRAVFQHDLWTVFDWVASKVSADAPGDPEARRALATRLARIIRRVALTRTEIDRLPDNYAAAVEAGTAPSVSGPQHWLALDDSFTQPIAEQHAAAFSASEFIVSLNVPGSGPRPGTASGSGSRSGSGSDSESDRAEATLDYLKTLWTFAVPYVAEAFRDGEQRVALNPKLPPLPAGTQVALMRRMLLIDDKGRICRTPLTQSVQLRVFRASQDFFEFQMRRRQLFAGVSGGFHAVAPDERGFIIFSAQGADHFENGPPPPAASGASGDPARRIVVMRQCTNCHAQPGVESLGIVRRLLQPNARIDYRHPRWSIYAAPAPVAKAQRYDWGLLQGLWQSAAW